MTLYDARAMRSPVPVFLALSVVVASTPSFAWTAATRVVMIDDAVKLMPTSLRKVLEKRRTDFSGALEDWKAWFAKATSYR